MIDLYAAGTSNGMRARIALEECGLKYNWHPIDLAKGEHKTSQFLALNPMGQIPVIVDNEGPGGKKVTLAQSSAIMVYCAEKAGKFIPKDAAKRAAMWEAYMSASTDITPGFGSVNACVRAKKPQQYAAAADMFKQRLQGYFKVWNDWLAKRKYAAGDEFSIADLSLYAGYWRTKGAFPELLGGMASLERWGNEMAARPAIQRAVKL
ncbi:MAG: glutathione S-transferase family protein [Betaproteobacteria bacterium]|nr:MAG: glutathione S-transferase family protein [Betaproteobacteria bacterium]